MCQGAVAVPESADHFEGMLVRKHEWETTVKKASHRSWDKVFAVLANAKLAFYKDQKHAKSVSYKNSLLINVKIDVNQINRIYWSGEVLKLGIAISYFGIF